MKIIRRSSAREFPLFPPLTYGSSIIDDIREMAGRSPRVRMTETPDSIVIRAELPGVREEDLDITLDENMLTIQAGREQASETGGAGYYSSEENYNYYLWSSRLPSDVDPDRWSVTSEQGVLELRIPKAGQKAGGPARSKSSRLEGARRRSGDR